MENQSTPIENLIHIDDSSTESSNLSASAQVLQKYNELENQTEERAQINQGTEQHQMDPAIANQHRMMELERARQFQMQYQQENQQRQPPPPPPPKPGFMDKIKNMTNNLGGKMIGPLIVVVLFVLFNLGIVDKTLTRLIPKVANGYGSINLKGVILKAIIVGIIFFVIKMFV
jgi:hypothetical protein